MRKERTARATARNCEKRRLHGFILVCCLAAILEAIVGGDRWLTARRDFEAACERATDHLRKHAIIDVVMIEDDLDDAGPGAGVIVPVQQLPPLPVMAEYENHTRYELVQLVMKRTDKSERLQTR